jgi:hypothetical protein
MRAQRLLIALLCLGLVLPGSVLGAQPSGTTKISGASAFFTSRAADGSCQRLIITLAQDAYRPVDGNNNDHPPVLSGWFDVQAWHEAICDASARADYVQQTINGLDSATYRILDLTAAYIRIDFPITDNTEVVRTIGFDVAWVADGSLAKTADRNPEMKVTGWEAGAHFTGVIDDSAGLIGIGNLDYATMGLGNYVMY